ncbi:hypothetical protein [Paenibacillus bouchesdurhonensis]|uniref:hypothetical protein n=1 Tax=Paenibacillus bouchesdurhonensis TaxID=1870990 RepID=UPI000DA61EDC|nr:hypothetical protein [Paenibacillus bouchesdurhonensis]
MSNFKDQLAKDAKNVFMNLEEFAEVRLIDNKAVEIIVDDDLLQKRRSLTNNPTDGVYSASFLFHVLKSSLPKKPVIDADMKVDKRTFKVADVQEDDAMYTITLKRTGS